MSLAKVNRRKARKDYKCEVDGAPINRGDEYLWYKVGFRSKFKHIRCLKHYPKNSERESSQLAEVYAAQEDAQAELRDERGNTDHDPEALTRIVNEFGEKIQEVADLYQEADQNFGGGGNTQNGERAEILQSAADELGNWSSDDLDVEEPEEDAEPIDQDVLEDNWEELVDAAEQMVNEVELP